jgi:hypothetical protein
LNLLLLVKSKRHLTHEQKAFLKSWTGQIAVVSSPEAALVKAEKMARRADQIRDRILNEPKAG